MSHRKDYYPLPDAKLDRLKADSRAVLGSLALLSLPAKTIYQMVMELIDSREEIFRLQLCETVDQIITKELEAEEEEDLLSFVWPEDNPYLTSDMLSTVSKPAFPCKETTEIPCPADPSEASPDQEGRRIPRVD